jgi:hypothetical protein
MKTTLSRLGMVAAGLVALLCTSAAPVGATTHLSAAFQGTMTLDGPFSYPCVGASAIDITLCPASPRLVTDLPLADDIVPTNFHIDYGHNKRHIISLGTTVCEDAAENLNKNDKAPTHVGACDLLLTPKTTPTADDNTVSGHCGLVGGQCTLLFTDALGQTFLLDIHFTSVFPPPTLLLTGHARKLTGSPQQTGKLVGEAEAVPLPDNFPAPPPEGNSCLAKSATLFTFTAFIEVVTM